MAGFSGINIQIGNPNERLAQTFETKTGTKGLNVRIDETIVIDNNKGFVIRRKVK